MDGSERREVQDGKTERQRDKGTEGQREGVDTRKERQKDRGRAVGPRPAPVDRLTLTEGSERGGRVEAHHLVHLRVVNEADGRVPATPSTGSTRVGPSPSPRARGVAIASG